MHVYDTLAAAPLQPVSAKFCDLAEAQLCYGRDQIAWVRACAIYYAAEHQITGVAEVAVEACRDANPIVRETALLGCARLAPQRAKEIAQALLNDEAAMVRSRASSMAGYELAVG